MYVSVSVCAFVYMCGAQGGQKRVLDFLELALAIGDENWVLRAESEPSEGGAHSTSEHLFSPGVGGFFFVCLFFNLFWFCLSIVLPPTS